MVEILAVPPEVTDVYAIREMVYSYMKVMSIKKSISHVYYSGSMESFGFRGETACYPFKKDNILQDYYLLLVAIKHDKERLEKILDQKNGIFEYVSGAKWNRYRELYERKSAEFKRLMGEAMDCFDDVRLCNAPVDAAKKEEIEWPNADVCIE